MLPVLSPGGYQECQLFDAPRGKEAHTVTRDSSSCCLGVGNPESRSGSYRGAPMATEDAGRGRFEVGSSPQGVALCSHCLPPTTPVLSPGSEQAALNLNDSGYFLQDTDSGISNTMSGIRSRSSVETRSATTSHFANGQHANVHLNSGHLSSGQLGSGHLSTGHSGIGHLSTGQPALGHLSTFQPGIGHHDDLSHKHSSTGHLSHLSQSYLSTGHINNSHSTTGHLSTGHLSNGHHNDSHLNQSLPSTGHSHNSHSSVGHLDNGHHNKSVLSQNHLSIGHLNTACSSGGHLQSGHLNSGHHNDSILNQTLLSTGHLNISHSSSGHSNIGALNNGHLNTSQSSSGHLGTGTLTSGHLNISLPDTGLLNNSHLMQSPIKSGHLSAHLMTSGHPGTVHGSNSGQGLVSSGFDPVMSTPLRGKPTNSYGLTPDSVVRSIGKLSSTESPWLTCSPSGGLPHSSTTAAIRSALEESEGRRQALTQCLKEAQHTIQAQSQRLSCAEGNNILNFTEISGYRFSEQELKRKVNMYELELQEQDRMRRECDQEREELQLRLEKVLSEHHVMLTEHKKCKDVNNETTAALLLLEEESNKLTANKEMMKKELLALKESLDISRSRNERLENEVKDTSLELGNLRQENSILSCKVSELSQQLEQLRATNEDLQQENRTLVQGVRGITEEKVTCSKQLFLLQENLADCKSKYLCANADKERFFQEKLDLQQRVQHLTQDRDILHNRALSFEEQLGVQQVETAEAKLETDRVTEEKRLLQEELNGVKKVSGTLSGELGNIKQQLESAVEKQHVLEQSQRVWQHEEQHYEQQVGSLEQEAERLRKERDGLRQDYERQTQSLDQRYTKLKEELNHAKSENVSLESSVSELELKLKNTMDSLRVESLHHQGETEQWQATCNKLSAAIQNKDQELTHCGQKIDTLEKYVSKRNEDESHHQELHQELQSVKDACNRLQIEKQRYLQERTENQQVIQLLEVQKELLAKATESQQGKVDDIEQLRCEANQLRAENSLFRDRIQEMTDTKEKILKDTAHLKRELAEYEKNKPSESVLLKKEEVERQNIQLREVNTLLTEQTQKLEKERLECQQQLALLKSLDTVPKHELYRVEKEKDQIQEDLKRLKESHHELETRHHKLLAQPVPAHGENGKNRPFLSEEKLVLEQQLGLNHGHLVVMENAKKRAEDMVARLQEELSTLKEERRKETSAEQELIHTLQDEMEIMRKTLRDSKIAQDELIRLRAELILAKDLSSNLKKAESEIIDLKAELSLTKKNVDNAKKTEMDLHKLQGELYTTKEQLALCQNSGERVHILELELSSLRQQLTKVTATQLELQGVKVDLEHNKRNLESCERRLERKETEVESLRADLDATKEKLNACRKSELEAQRLTAELENCQARISKERFAMKGEVQIAEQRTQHLECELLEAGRVQEKQQHLIQSLRAELEDEKIKASYKPRAIRKSLDDVGVELIQMRHELQNLLEVIQAKDGEIEQLDQQISELQAELEEKDAEMATKTQVITTKIDKIGELELQNTELRRELEEKKSELGTKAQIVTEKIEELELQNTEFRRELEEKKSELGTKAQIVTEKTVKIEELEHHNTELRRELDEKNLEIGSKAQNITEKVDRIGLLELHISDLERELENKYSELEKNNVLTITEKTRIKEEPKCRFSQEEPRMQGTEVMTNSDEALAKSAKIQELEEHLSEVRATLETKCSEMEHMREHLVREKEEEIEEWKLHLAQTKDELEEKHSETEKLRLNLLNEKDSKIQELSTALIEVENLMENKIGSVDEMLSQVIGDKEKEANELKAQMAEVKDTLQEKECIIAKLVKDKENETQELNMMKRTLEDRNLTLEKLTENLYMKESEILQSEQKFFDLKASMESKVIELEKIKSKVTQKKDEEIEQLNVQLSEFKAAIEVKDREKKEVKEQLAEVSAAILDKDAEIKQILEMRQEKDEKYLLLEEQLELARKSLQMKDEELRKIAQKHPYLEMDLCTREDQVVELQTSSIGTEDLNREELTDMDVMKKHLGDKIERLEKELCQLKEEKEELRCQMEKCENKKQDVERQFEEFKTSLADYLDVSQTKLDQVKEKHNAEMIKMKALHSEQLKRKENQLSTLKQTLEKLTGDSDSPHSVEKGNLMVQLPESLAKQLSEDDNCGSNLDNADEDRPGINSIDSGNSDLAATVFNTSTVDKQEKSDDIKQVKDLSSKSEKGIHKNTSRKTSDFLNSFFEKTTAVLTQKSRHPQSSVAVGGVDSKSYAKGSQGNPKKSPTSKISQEKPFKKTSHKVGPLVHVPGKVGNALSRTVWSDDQDSTIKSGSNDNGTHGQDRADFPLNKTHTSAWTEAQESAIKEEITKRNQESSEIEDGMDAQTDSKQTSTIKRPAVKTRSLDSLFLSMKGSRINGRNLVSKLKTRPGRGGDGPQLLRRGSIVTSTVFKMKKLSTVEEEDIEGTDNPAPRSKIPLRRNSWSHSVTNLKELNSLCAAVAGDAGADSKKGRSSLTMDPPISRRPPRESKSQRSRRKARSPSPPTSLV